MKKFISKNGVTSQSQSLSGGKPNSEQASPPVVGRRSFLKGLGATGAVLLPGSALLMSKAQAQEMTKKKGDDSGGQLTKGDAAILSFVAAAEILESDLWEQYWELGGLQANDFASFQPWLERIVALKREEAQAIGFGKGVPYDALLQRLFPGYSLSQPASRRYQQTFL